MKSHVIVKTHELALKGKNRPWFMRRLVQNLQNGTQGTGVERVWQGQLLVGLTLTDEDCWPAVRDRVRDCFGVAKFFKAYTVSPEIEKVKEALPSLLAGYSFKSFRITANRADKRFPMNSDEICRDLGKFVQDLSGAAVNLTAPEFTVFVDVHPGQILVYFQEVPGYGGLPVGVSGRVTAMLSGGIDSPVAAWYMMKRGCPVNYVHFHSYPLVDRSSMEKAEELAQHLHRYQNAANVTHVPLGEIQKRIIVSSPPAYRVIMYRRFMVRITEVLARRQRAKAIITGESCGQVSSQTLENMAVIDDVAGMPILRPLVGFNKEEIIVVARNIGTFPISIQPDQDCCSLFVPKHPETKADLETVKGLEAALPVDDLVQEALAGVEVKRLESSVAEALT